MKSYRSLHTGLGSDSDSDLEKRIELVMSVHRQLGYVTRKKLIEIYGLSQLQAGSWMRDFIRVYAKNLKWNMKQAHYSMRT